MKMIPSIQRWSLLFLLAFSGTWALAQTALRLPPGVQKITTVEGITEYSLPNGLRVLLFPDPSKPIMTVNITYKVGSRHENYGETGMAHLLEHLVFKGTPRHPNIPQELTEHGARPNGTTWLDRTNYFETFDASDGFRVLLSELKRRENARVTPGSGEKGRVSSVSELHVRRYMGPAIDLSRK